MPVKTLIEMAVEHYNDLQISRGTYKSASIKDDPEFLARISANFLRHELTDYEHKLSDMFGQIGRQEGYELLKERINKKIIKTYPWIKKNYPNITNRERH